LERYNYFAAVFSLFCLTIFFYILSFILNFKIEIKKDEEKRRIKKIKSKIKYDFRDDLKKITEINDRCVKAINIISGIFIAFLILYWIGSITVHSFGYIKDKNNVDTENDFKYLVEYSGE
jgi:hypothetical protein